MIVVVGANGQVGRELASQARARGSAMTAFDRQALDITDDRAVPQVLAAVAGLGVVINAAAYTQVDRAEDDAQRAWAVNATGPRVLAAACQALDVPLIHLSTDYVFDGRATNPYHPTAPTNPLGVYGQSKWAGEQAVRASGARHLIIRTSWVFSPWGHNFVKTMVRLAKEREVLRVVADQQGNPTGADSLAAALLALTEPLENGADVAWGTYHFCGTPPTTWWGLAEATVAEARRYGPLAVRSIDPITSADYPTKAPRPAFSALDCRGLTALGLSPPLWRDSLARTVEVLLAHPPTPDKVSPRGPMP